MHGPMYIKKKMWLTYVKTIKIFSTLQTYVHFIHMFGYVR